MGTTTNQQAGLTPAAELAEHRKPMFPGESEEYSQARKKLLAEEIEFRRHMTRLSEQRKALPPGPVIGADYRFRHADGSEVACVSSLVNTTHSSPISGCTVTSASVRVRCVRTGWAG